MITCPWCGTTYPAFQIKNCGGPLPFAETWRRRCAYPIGGSSRAGRCVLYLPDNPAQNTIYPPVM